MLGVLASFQVFHSHAVNMGINDVGNMGTYPYKLQVASPILAANSVLILT